MKLDPGFISHWKTERLIAELGGDGVVAVLRLWGNAQIRREWKGLRFTPRRLAMETKWKGDENHLFSVLTDPDAPWLDLEEGGTFSIHGFDTHQRQVIHLWESGQKGGRPRKVSLDSSKEEEKKEYSSSYPICEPNGNQMVFEVDKSRKIGTNGFKAPTQEEAIEAGKVAGISRQGCIAWWNARESNGWLKGTAGGGTTPIGNWRADLSRSKSWAEEEATKSNPSDKSKATRYL